MTSAFGVQEDCKMGSSLSHSSRSLCRDSNGNVNNSSNKENRGSKPKFASPENRVLPVVTNGPTRLRSTDNGSILQSGGTISGRKSIQQPDSENFSDFTRFLQKKSQAYQSSPQNVSFQTLFGHRKSHSDPDIVRKMMEENETEEDDDGRCETESNPNQRSIIALSPSKAKIKSRKKKKAPEPPQANTLPRTITGRSSKYEAQEISKFNSTYESTEAPRRPLPPIPLDEMPPPPPPPPPDYNRTINNREILKVSGKNFQKNRRIVDKWKFCKPNSENFAERRQRSKSLDRTDDARLREKELNPDAEKFDRNYSLRNLSHHADSNVSQKEDISQSAKNNALHDAIIDAAKKRAERIARNRNLSFRSSMDQSYEVQTNDKGQMANSPVDNFINERNPYRNGHVQSNTHGYRNLPKYNDQGVKVKEQTANARNLESDANKLKFPFQNGNSELNANILLSTPKGFIEQRISRSSENLDDFNNGQRHIFERENSNRSANHIKDQYAYKQYYSSNHSIANSNSNGDVSLKESVHDFTNHELYHRNSRDSSSVMQYKSDDKVSLEYSGNRYRNENVENFRSRLTEKTENHQHSPILNSLDVMKQTNYSYYKPENGYPINDSSNNISRSFSRVSAIRKRSQDNKKKCSPDYKLNTSENCIEKHHDNTKRLDLGILPPLPNDTPVKRNPRPQETIIPFLSNCTVSSSSISEEEMEINLQLRPTLPRRTIDIPRFSPTDVWKSINLDFFKSHQQRSDVSSENGEDIMEEKIHRINRPVAPRRLIHDRSGDSGISPDAGSPMFLNETLDSPITNTVLCSQNETSNDDGNNTWIPQHDLDDSECGSETSRENKFNKPNEIVQPKLAMPNFMFPSRSLPRSDSKNEIQENEIPEKEKPRSRDKRKKGVRNSETQHFNSLRNLKRALGIKPKVTAVDVNGLDSNWSLSRSLPSIENVNNIDDAKIENVPDANALDHIRRSNSESKMMQQENNKVYSVHQPQYKNSEWRKSFPGQSSDGHVMYLPQYCSTTMPCLTNPRNRELNYVEEAKVNNENEQTDTKLDFDSADKKSKCKKKFSYQSTIRQLEKKKLEEQLAKEIEEKEKRRQTEIEWMNIVEDEFRKQRIREKSDVKQKLRIYNLEANKEGKFSSGNDSQYCINEANTEISNERDVSNVFESDVQCSNAIVYDMNGANVPQNAQNVSIDENSRTSRDIFLNSDLMQHSAETSDQRVESYLQGVESSRQQTHVQRKFYREISAISKTIQKTSYQRHEEQMKVINDTSQNSDISQRISKTMYSKKMISNGRMEPNGREVPVDRNFINEKQMNGDNGNENSGFVGDYSKTVNTSSYFGQNNIQRLRKMKDSNTSPENFQANNHDKINNYINNASDINSSALSDKRRESNHQHYPNAKEDGRFEKVETTYNDRIPQTCILPFKDNDERKNMVKDNDVSYNTQQPTGMKKWLRRQNREHHRHENIPRPEPEGGRSSSDDCKQIDGKREIPNGRSQPIGANFPSNIKCSHARSFQCNMCNQYNPETPVYSRNGVEINVSSIPPPVERICRSEKSRDDRHEVHPKTQISKMNGNVENQSDIPEFVRNSMEEYELHTRLCRTNSGRTFESHSYYALERRRDDSAEYESSRKPIPSKEPQPNFFSSANFEKELKENVRKKSRDMEKRIRKYQPQTCDFDSDDSGSDGKEARYQRHNTRNLKKRLVSEHREPSFSRNHPHRNGARLKSQTNGHFNNGRSPSTSKNNHSHTVQEKLPNSGL